jgi:hypothetical protein
MRTSTFSRTIFLKPDSSAVKVYTPGVRYRMLYSPSPFVVVLNETLVATLVAVTVTPGSRPPEPSVMVPVMLPLPAWA